MGVAIEGYCVVVLNERLDSLLPGGRDALRPLATGPVLQDEHLSAISYMSETDADQFTLELAQACCGSSLNALDAAIVSQHHEVPAKKWLRAEPWHLGFIAWRAGEDLNPIHAPEGWDPANPRLQFCTEDEIERLEFLGEKDGVSAYRDPETGQLSYVGRQKSRQEELYDHAVVSVGPFLQISDATPPDIPPAERQQILEKGIADFRSALETNPESWGAWWHLGKTYQALGSTEEAFEAFERAYALQYENANVAREYAFECLNLGYIEKAVAAAEQAVAAEPDNDGLVSNLGLVLMFAGRYEEALQQAKRAYHMHRDSITKNLIQVIKDVKNGRRPQPRRMSDL